MIGFLFIGISGALSQDLGGLTLGLSFGLIALVAYLAVAIIGGLAVGTLCGFLGSLIALDRARPAQYY